MGEAKRRRTLDPNYGKARELTKNNIQNDISPLLNALINLPNNLCWELFTTSNSSESLGDEIEIPIDQNTESIISRLFWRETLSPTDTQTIENISTVCSDIRQNNHDIWCDLYRIFCLVDQEILFLVLKNKSTSEVDYLLRSMILFEIACPCIIDDDEEFWSDDTSPTPTEISNFLLERLSKEEYSNTEVQQLKAFCSRVGSLFSRKWAEHWFELEEEVY
ncbi:hypothetical protein H6G97_31770 [Nostoc flagelliforme FACHB-838]|uniref:Uncharacterized protein n=1 Tax=Nostoc flagelliforme FACHB-838 TaxID=2692904 RepID=A0ABR8DWN2_9NOSO|nr:hypothetical protein [Nostoc flagelliforme]MBD2533882.1 hypothetical protein [Nostoc flagelliforme FACHB-838]